MICGHRHEQKFRYPYPRNSKKIQMPYPRAKTIDQNPNVAPPPPSPRRLDIDRCITPVLQVLSWVHVKKIKQQKSGLLSKSNRKILV